MYCIVDIETTGNGIIGNKITEIAIFKFDGQKIVDQYSSLVNPQCEIPYFITGLTGIDNHMVRNSPAISDIAQEILDFTKDMIFVAHSVNFDYNVIKNEFRNLGLTFVRKKLCTVRLSRRTFPGLQSYSLGKLCSALEIPLTDRHRAGGDARATVSLFKKILNTNGSEKLISTFLNARSQEATLPPSLSRETYENLPSEPGIYYFKDSSGKIIYVGKAKNIKKRVLGHFYDKSEKEVRLCRETADIDFELSGSELVALLMESAAIKHHFPLYNRAQKYRIGQYGIFRYTDRKGIIHLAYNNLKNIPQPLITFTSTTDCRIYLELLAEQFDLCARYCQLQESQGPCSHYKLTDCKGICRDEEDVAAYNARVKEATDWIRSQQENILIRESGRTPDEDAMVLIRDGRYSGYGFVPVEAPIVSEDDLLAHIESQKDTPEARRLVISYAARNPEKITSLG